MSMQKNVFSSPAAKALYALGVTPNQMIFWVMIAAAKTIFENPFSLTAIRGEVYPPIEKCTGLTSAAIDSLLRRTSKVMMTEKNFAPLRAYLPHETEDAPPVGVFLSMWVRMVADQAKVDGDTSDMIE